MVLNSSVSSKSCDAFLQAESQMHNIDEDVEKMNFKLISVESSIRRLLAERQSTGTECHGSVFANQTKSRKNLEAAASKLLLSREKQQDRIIRLRLKKDWEQETKLINDVAIPALKLSDKSAALINASRKKLFEKKFQLVKLNSELKTMNLQSVTLTISISSQSISLILLCLTKWVNPILLGYWRNYKCWNQNKMHRPKEKSCSPEGFCSQGSVTES